MSSSIEKKSESLILDVVKNGYMILPKEGNLSLIKIKAGHLSSRLIEHLKKNKNLLLSYLKKMPKFLSYQQQALLFIDQLGGGFSPEYNINLALYLPADINLNFLEKALNTIINQNPQLHSKFLMHDNYAIHQCDSNLSLSFTAKIVNSEEELDTLIQLKANQPFNLKQDVPLNVDLYKQNYNDEMYCMTFKFHHIIIDGWSIDILLHQLSNYYIQQLNHHVIEEPESTISFFEYCQWQYLWYGSEASSQEILYWQKQLEGYKGYNFNTQVNDTKENSGNNITFKINKELNLKVLDFCKNNDCTLFPFLTMNLALMLRILYHLDDVVIGSPFSNRCLPEFEALLGYFANTLPIRCKMNGNQTVKVLLNNIKKTCLDAADNQWVPFNKIVGTRETESIQTSNPLVDIFLALHSQRRFDSNEYESPFLSIKNIYSGFSRFLLAFDFTPEKNALSCNIEYKSSSFDQNFIEQLFEFYAGIVNFVIENPEIQLSTLEKKIRATDFFSAFHLFQNNKKNKNFQGEKMRTFHDEPTHINPTNKFNETKYKIKNIWQEVLKHPIQQTNKSFFSMGGTSILSVSLMRKINEIFNVNYPVSWVFQNPTIDKQAYTFQKFQLSNYQSIIKFREGGPCPPLIFIHPSLVGAEIYHDFFTLLDSHQAFFSVENFNLIANQLPLRSYPELANLYNQFIQDELAGKFYLGGYCYGAVLALEMAIQLAKQNKPVNTLYLIDPLLMFDNEKPGDKTENELLSMAGYVRLPNGEFVPEASEDHIKRLLSTGILDREMIYTYSKSIPVYSHRVLLFLAEKKPGGHITFEKELNFWHEHLPNAEIVTLNANHKELLEPKYLSKITEKIQNDLFTQLNKANLAEQESAPIIDLTSPQSNPSSTDKLIKKALYIREFEMMLLDLFSQGKVYGTVHTCVGQELSPVCIMQYIVSGDLVFSNHRGHGHFLAYGGDPKRLLAEILGKDVGVCRGIGGSQHLYTPGYYSNGIQGGMVPVAAGCAFSLKLSNKPNIAIVFIGDGTLGEGVVYETMNIASKWSLPLLIVVENNLYAQSTSIEQNLAGSVRGRAQAFDITYIQSNTNNLSHLQKSADKAVSYARNFQSPVLLEIMTYRLNAHSKGDDNRDASEINYYKNQDLINQYLEKRPGKYSDYLSKIKLEFATMQNELQNEKICQFTPSKKKVEANSIRWQISLKESTNVQIADLIYKSLNELFEKNSEAFLIGEDVHGPYGGAFNVTRDLSQRYPNQVFSTPISEAAILGVATGLALTGKLAIVEIMFGDFLTLIFDQLYQHACKFHKLYAEQVNVPFILRTPMGGRRGYGPTHSQSIEKFFIGIPGLKMLALNFRVSPYKIYTTLFEKIDNPVLVIENKLLYGQCIKLKPPLGFHVNLSDECYPSVKITPVDDTPELTIACYGGMLPIAEEAALKIFEEYEILCEIICPTQIYPVNLTPIANSVKKTKKLITLEEGPAITGWGCELLASLIESGICLDQFRRLGYDDIIPASFELENALLPNVKLILDVIEEFQLCR